MGIANSKSEQALRYVALAVLPLMLTSCQAETNERVVQKPTKPIAAKPIEPEGKPRLLTGQELKDTLVGWLFSMKDGTSYQMHVFRKDGFYGYYYHGEGSTENYIIKQNNVCIYLKHGIVKQCIKIYFLKENSYKFIITDKIYGVREEFPFQKKLIEE
jgi:hypothetical protein